MPSSAMSCCWNRNASASVKALFGTPCSSVWSIVVTEKISSMLCPSSWTAML
jgi:hypothetical protein